MQAGDGEDAVTVKEEQEDMTLKELEGSSPLSEATKPVVNLGTFQTIQDGDYKLSEVNYDAEIEKIVPDSPASSEDNSTPETEATTPDVTKPDHIKANLAQNESIRSWLQKISQMQSEIQQKLSMEQQHAVNNQQHQFSEFPVVKNTKNDNAQTQTSSPRVVKYQDLPYMGEITLDNSKPRRGRKPKKADICHLIYKNYGTIFPGTPNPKSLLDTKTKSTIDRDSDIQRSDVQNKIISSLLEKRLTQDTKMAQQSTRRGTKTEKHAQNEPLNLCVRDLNQLKIRLLRKSNDCYDLSKVKSEPNSDSEVEVVPSTHDIIERNNDTDMKNMENPSGNHGTDGTNPLVYWPNGGLFIHPLALQQQLMYYQKFAGTNNRNLGITTSTDNATVNTDLVPRGNSNNSSKNKKSSTSTNTTSSTTSGNSSSTNSNNVANLRQHTTTSSTTSNKHSSNSTVSNSSTSINNNEMLLLTNAEDTLHSTSSSKHVTSKRVHASSDKSTIKRKRSAIFIPPIPSENQNNPATEVSICKFKFTGGAKPSLQEKKMLSVDSGGNFRYYSGTGDKSMRGYEFFPRETLQQQIGNAQGSSTGAFLQASGEKIHPNAMVDFSGTKANEFMLTPELPMNIPRLNNTELVPTGRTGSNVGTMSGSTGKKRKSRKSIQREKLEQTFKEKGFLIQTQQLESAEGATYCKFRQLRKFTRYLFRSWKDYLPGSVTTENGENVVEKVNSDHELESDSESLSSRSATASMVNTSDVKPST